MAPSKAYVCACLERDFDNQRAFTVHQNVCPVVKQQERELRYAPYRRTHARATRTAPTMDVPVGEKDVSIDEHASMAGTVPDELSHPEVEADKATGSSTPNVPNNPPSIPATHSYPATRSRTRRLFEGHRDTFEVLPEAPPPLDEDINAGPSQTKQSIGRTRTRLVPFETPVDSFGRFRIYPSKPTTIPDCDAELADFVDQHFDTQLDFELAPSTSVSDAIYPCPNLSTFYFLRWFWKGSNKSIASREELLNILLRSDFNPADLAGVNLSAIDKKLASTPYLPQDHGSFAKSDGWTEKSVPIQVPARAKGPNKGPKSGHRVAVPGLHSRKILTGIKRAFQENKSPHFHHEPHHLRWIPPGASKSEAQTLMGEIYNSPEMIEAHKEIQGLKISDKKCTLPRVCAAVMFGSDALQLGPFSTQKAWMMYMWLGNLSKYERCKPNSGSCFDLAHIPSLPDSVKDEITKLNGRPPSSSLLTYLRRELMHAVLHELLDAEFLQAWQHGIKIKCADGIERRVFPRIFTYSADYPERVLLATIRDKGKCPCPRCLVPMDLVHKMGTRSDMHMRMKKARRDSRKRQKLIQQAKKLIFDKHKAVDNKEVEALLQPELWVPTENAFSRRLFPFDFDVFKIFVVDLLHEIELGVWKSLLTHLLRILHSCGSDIVAEFNKRYDSNDILCSTIRKFSEDVASLKRLAARDLEDILQCCIPIFKGLLPKSIDSQVQKLLFTLSYWHGLAKLRQHTSATHKKLSEVTFRLGDELRAFQDATNQMEIYETSREFSARQRKAAARTKNQKSSTQSSVKVTRKLCKLNLNTPKFHAVGHYVAIIARYGTTDSFSTQTTELQHRKIKAQWFRTNMRDAISQMTRIGDIGDALDAIQGRLDRLRNETTAPAPVGCSSNQEGQVDIRQAYGIGQSDRLADAVNMVLWVNRYSHEPCMKYFIFALKQHLLPRITGNPSATDFGNLTLMNDRMYAHATLHINYTSYDVRRQYDVINPRSSSPFILLPNDTSDDPTAHPFLYAKVLGIYHAKVRYGNRPPKGMDFLWVRWLDYDEDTPGSWELGRLDRVHYARYRSDIQLQDAFGFVDPRHIIRACHLIPDFSSGHIEDSVSLICDDDKGDWKHHYVGRFIDRDMVMRYVGGGVGHFDQHTPAEAPTNYSLDDTEAEDMEVEPNEYDEANQTEELGNDDEQSVSGEAVHFEDDDAGYSGSEDDSDGTDDDDDATDEEDFIEDLYDP
ncbi:hypothetical protein FRC12_008574 [Ceratobasidium sp. 428]|nr:hypothetical protein FRC09_007135 [Ceratobasidium sp. 395]KAG8763368.1 hypothetical protein FRC12_008574 [Ceratobasidium sp. 428]